MCWLICGRKREWWRAELRKLPKQSNRFKIGTALGLNVTWVVFMHGKRGKGCMVARVTDSVIPQRFGNSFAHPRASPWQQLANPHQQKQPLPPLQQKLP
jgi:hypothetical protein